MFLSCDLPSSRDGISANVYTLDVQAQIDMLSVYIRLQRMSRYCYALYIRCSTESFRYAIVIPPIQTDESICSRVHRPSTPPNYSPGSSRNAEFSNCKHLRRKISVLKATMDMHMHPEQHTVNSAALLHEKEVGAALHVIVNPLRNLSDVRIEVRGLVMVLMCLYHDEESNGAVPSKATMIGKEISYAQWCMKIGTNSGQGNTPSSRKQDLVIRFDVEKEEFGLIDPPKRMCDIWRDHYSCINDHLVDLNGEVGFVCVRTMEIWVLKQKEWVPYCRLENTIVPGGCMESFAIKKFSVGPSRINDMSCRGLSVSIAFVSSSYHEY
ncbi:F-box domain containing protein [Tanacetum coccineum]